MTDEIIITDIKEKLRKSLEESKNHSKRKIDYSITRTYQFKAPIENLLKNFSKEELDHMDDKYAEEIDFFYMDAQLQYEEAKRTCPENMPIERWQLLYPLMKLFS